MSATARVATAKPSYSFAQHPVVARLNPAVETQRRTPEYTNDSKPFNQPQNTRVNENGNTQQNPRVTNNPPANNQPQSNNGFRPFTPPGSNNRTTTQPDNRNAPSQVNRTQPPQNEERPAMKFTQPTKARDEMYDVHPPLNHQQNNPAPKQEQQHSSSSSHSDEHPPKK